MGRVRDDRRKRNTPLIPEPVSQILLDYAASLFKPAPRLLEELKQGLRDPCCDSELSLLTDACSYLPGALTGMRCSEISGINAGAWRVEP